MAIEAPEPTPEGPFGQFQVGGFAQEFFPSTAGGVEERDGEPVLEVAAHSVYGESGGWGVLSLATCALVEVAGGDMVGAPESAASTNESVGPNEAAQAVAATVVGAVAFDESGVEAGEVVDWSL